MMSAGHQFQAETEGFFNLVFSHLFCLYSVDSPQTKQFVTRILQIISSAPSENVTIKYRM